MFLKLLNFFLTNMFSDSFDMTDKMVGALLQILTWINRQIRH